MNIKEYFEQNKIKISYISRETGLPYTTVGDIINGKTDIDNTSVKVLFKISNALCIPVDKFYEMAKAMTPTPELGEGYSLQLKKNIYYIIKNNKAQFLCKNNEANAHYIKDIAQTYINNAKRRERMQTWKTTF